MIGGLVAIHDAGGINNLNCDSNIDSYGIQRLEAMRYAINKVILEFVFNWIFC